MGKKNKSKGIPPEVKESAHKIWLAGLGAFKVAQEEGSKLFKNLVEQGEKLEERSRDEIDKMRTTLGRAGDRAKGTAEDTWTRMEKMFDERLGDALNRLGVPTRSEISALAKRVEGLTKAVESLHAKKTAAAKPAAKKPAATRPAAKKSPAAKKPAPKSAE